MNHLISNNCECNCVVQRKNGIHTVTSFTEYELKLDYPTYYFLCNEKNFTKLMVLLSIILGERDQMYMGTLKYKVQLNNLHQK